MTRKTAHGLVIGKFYPLHAGHLALLRFASERSQRLTIVLMWSQFESIPRGTRERWLRTAAAELGNARVLAVPCDAPVDYGADIAWHANAAILREALDAGGAPPVTGVFSSELYGVELAARFGAEPVLYDIDRTGHRVSGTAVRRDLVRRWDRVAPIARLDLATRVIVVGAESTGTTTLARDLGEHYRANGFPHLRDVEEYGRELTYRLHAEASRAAGATASMDAIAWRPEHFAEAATTQLEREQEAALACPLVIADTDPLATEVWERRYLGEDSTAAASVNRAGLPPRAVYLVTDHVGVPFEQDGWRDGEHLRAEMTSWFTAELTRRGESWVLLRGDRAERLRYARLLIDALWEQRSTFASPPWADRTVLRAEVPAPADAGE
ncbi:AAA family ATPase [Microbacterium sp. SS28]|uniref:AAA family ATPase n=1 Tax=Microbacterium sp. SS28 TaxID=2919948 RepID=UPI001FAA317D|nr:AAA family ATPase [Microbacterium sp. SS28]